MSEQHTPGPWIIREGDFDESEFVITTEARQELGIVSICEINVYFDGDIGAEQKADARLIAAAPELLAALQAGPSTEHALPFGNVCSCSQCEFVRLRRAAIAKAIG